ncbi:hypothetical protein UXQ08_12435 [Enterobacter ludwigii]|uniref:hypothetical protein n=1 Tax=Enterobacter ludwigii TaxID=299767 RepID=UPI002FD72642
MSLHSQDWINIAIATGTAAAAFASWRSARIAKQTANDSLNFMQTQLIDEKDRWLTELLFSFAEQCNREINTKGQIANGSAGLSRIATITHSAINLIHRYKSDDENRLPHLYNYWGFLHSAVWTEFTDRDLLLSEGKTGGGMFSFPDEGWLKTLSQQYDFIESHLLKKVNKQPQA